MGRGEFNFLDQQDKSHWWDFEPAVWDVVSEITTTSTITSPHGEDHHYIADSDIS
jgi:hypothetical protein